LHWTPGRTLASHAGAGPEAEADRAEADDELRNLYALNLRETNEILDRAQDRMSPILAPDQRAKSQKLIEERERRIEQ